MTLVDTAKDIALRAHAGQFRRDGVTPYWKHPERVARRLAGDTVAEAVAWLHDVLEDSDETEATLEQHGVPAEVVEAVKLLTKKPGVSYQEYLRAVRGNPLAKKVKIQDMLDNLADSPTEHQIKKYAFGLLMLCGSEADVDDAVEP